MKCVLAGMDLFEEALRRWEEALMFRSTQADDDLISLKTGAADAVAEENMEVTCFCIYVWVPSFHLQ